VNCSRHHCLDTREELRCVRRCLFDELHIDPRRIVPPLIGEPLSGSYLHHQRSLPNEKLVASNRPATRIQVDSRRGIHSRVVNEGVRTGGQAIVLPQPISRWIVSSPSGDATPREHIPRLGERLPNLEESRCHRRG
jgi:hypothetical protein